MQTNAARQTGPDLHVHNHSQSCYTLVNKPAQTRGPIREYRVNHKHRG